MGLPYHQYHGNARRLTWECKLPILVGRKTTKVLRFLLGLCVNKNLHKCRYIVLEYDLLQEVTEPSQPIDLRLSHAQMPIFFGSLLRYHPSSKGLNLGEKPSPLFQLVLKFCLCACFFFYGSQLTGKKSSSGHKLLQTKILWPTNKSP